MYYKYCQPYLSDPASTTIEGIFIYVILLCAVLVLFVVWFIYSMDSKTIETKASSLVEDTLGKKKQKTNIALLKLLVHKENLVHNGINPNGIKAILVKDQGVD